MVVQSKELRTTKEAQAKTLIMRAWRERWTDVQWGIHVRSLIDPTSTDASFISNCILQQALSGPGPNSLVLSYLMHSIYSQIISTCDVLKSVNKYDGFHKPYCVASLLDLLDNIKERIILNDSEELDQCMELAIALASVIHWLLTCMYSSLENLSDMAISDFPADAEDSKIVLKCRKLIEFFLTDSFLAGLIKCAVLQNDEVFQNIKKMSREVAKFLDGHHHQDIAFITGLIEAIEVRGDSKSSKNVLNLYKSVDGKQTLIGSPSIQTIIISAALLQSANDIPSVATDLQIIKNLKGTSNVELYSEVMHSSMVGLIDCLSNKNELKVMGFTFFVLPSLFKKLSEKLNAPTEDFVKGLNLFLDNDCILDIADTKLNCFTLEMLLNSYQKLNLLNDSDKAALLQKKKQHSLTTTYSSSSASKLLLAESNLQTVLKTLDGDYTKNQDAILAALNELIGDNLEFDLTAAACTKKLQLLSSKLLKLNQSSRQVTGEAGKASATRAMIFDITFIILCYIVQNYGSQFLPADDTDSFFVEWCRDCMIENNTAKNPEGILNRCDQNKVDMLLNQYLQGDTELKTSLVFWHELCTNAVGVVRELLLAWECDSYNFTDVKKILDVFRSRICSLPICISVWLCSHIQIIPEDQSGKAKYILNHFLSSLPNEEDYFKERFTTMSKIINKMVNCVQQPSTLSSPMSPTSCEMEGKPVSDLYKKCFACMQTRGVINMDTMLTLKSLMDITGPHCFVQGMVTEMMENQCSVELLQWSGMLYGVFHINLAECTTALLRIVIPSMLHYWNKDSNFVEPQILALVSLAVDCILSYYLHIKQTSTKLESDSGDGAEPSTKRRKLTDKQRKSEKLTDLEFMLQELYDEFDKNLRCRSEARPQAIFILRFLEHLSMKTPDSALVSSLPGSIITQLMSVMCDEINTKMLLGWHSLTETSGRTNCALNICSLKHMQNADMYSFGSLS